MNWKEWSYWLKGGIIGLVLGIVIFIVHDIHPSFETFALLYRLSFPSVLLLNFFLGFAPLFRIPVMDARQILHFFLIVLNLFVVGVIIGWIVGKIRNKK